MKSRVETGVIVWIILVINKLFFMIFSVIFLLGFATVSFNSYNDNLCYAYTTPIVKRPKILEITG